LRQPSAHRAGTPCPRRIGPSTLIARQRFAAITEERDALQRELEWIQQQLIELLSTVRELRAAVLARQQAEAELAGLYRERAIARARAAERDPNAMLN